MLGPGDIAPDFELPCASSGRASKLRLSDSRTDYMTLFFYPRDFSFICPTEVSGFNQALKSFADARCAVLGISIDDVDSHLKWAAELGGIDYPLLSDVDGQIARAYGVFDENEKVALRATFVMRKNRAIMHAVACPFNVGRSVADTLRVVQAITTGRMCPAEWKPGVEFGPQEQKF
ncbi:MAG TPA: redoxin domain-containing protein [Candidatus Binataceae bacterium]|nr:redoxin domain-containing protein [Candidatus Binataceae bacterium]